MKVDTDRIVNTNATALLQQGEAAIRGGESHFDLSNVQRCDSSAVALLLAWERAARERGMRLGFAGIPASLRSLAKLYGVDVLIPMDGAR